MSRVSERARILQVLSIVLVSGAVLGSLGGCEQLDGRIRNRKGGRLFRETQFVDAAAEYETALKVVDAPIIHYNLGLAYSKIFKPGFDGPVLLGTEGEFVCNAIPGVKLVEAGACVKPGDRHYAECGAAKSAPIEKQIAELQAQLQGTTDEDKKKDLDTQIKGKRESLNRFICASSFTCLETKFCTLSSADLADLAAQHLQVWIKAQPSDEEIKQLRSVALRDLEEAKQSGNNAHIAAAQRQVDELGTKDQTRKLMTKRWIESEQYPKALAFWEDLIKERPNDTEIMGILAGINSSAGDWRKSIEWYGRVADVTNDPNIKVAEYQLIGNIAWAKLNSKSLVGTAAIELADRGIGALQKASELQPKNYRLTSLQGSIFNFRSTAHGTSWAAAIDRASAQDLSQLTRVLVDEQKKAQQEPAPGTPPTSPPPVSPTPASASPSPPPGSPGSSTPAAPGSPAGSAGSAAPTGSAGSSGKTGMTGGKADKSGG